LLSPDHRTVLLRLFPRRAQSLATEQKKLQRYSHFSTAGQDLGYEHSHLDIFGSYTTPEGPTMSTQKEKKPNEYLKPKTAQERIHLKFWHPPSRHDDQLYTIALACSASTEALPLGKGAIMLPHQNS